jgi:hypothetical protein
MDFKIWTHPTTHNNAYSTPLATKVFILFAKIRWQSNISEIHHIEYIDIEETTSLNISERYKQGSYWRKSERNKKQNEYLLLLHLGKFHRLGIVIFSRKGLHT